MIVDDIVKKKTLKNLDREYVEELLPASIPDKKRKYKEVIKKVRNELNRVYGVFNLGSSLDLRSHQSSKERLKIYPLLYKRIFTVTGNPKSILDLGCGLNPLSYSYLGCKPKYIASEWNTKDCLKLGKWFKSKKIKGKVVKFDLRKENKYPKVDVVFLFKVLGVFKDHKIDEQIIRSLNCKYVVASFSTHVLKGHRMRYPRQGWLNQMLKRLGLSYSMIEFENEQFYVIKL